MAHRQVLPGHQAGIGLGRLPETQVERLAPAGDERVVIGVLRHEPGRNGSVELIDGAHRVVMMLACGITSTRAYIGEVNET